jgi:hypothetical protein
VSQPWLIRNRLIHIPAAAGSPLLGLKCGKNQEDEPRGKVWHTSCFIKGPHQGGTTMQDRHLEILSVVTIIVLVVAWAALVL